MPVVKIYRGTEAPTTREERKRLQAEADAARAHALLPKPDIRLTREQLIEIAQQNGAPVA